MDLEELKSNYRKSGHATVGRHDLQKMTHAGQHPSLKKMRLQLIIETACWAFFLLVYYDFFDGHLRPFFWNALLVLAVALLLLHNVLGYRMAMNPVQGATLIQSLRNYLTKMRRYAGLSIASRVLAITCLVLFFIPGITFTAAKYWAVAGVVALIVVQVYALRRVWQHRINRISESVRGLEE